MEVCSGSHANYDDIHIFGYPAYYHVRDEKFNSRVRKALFLDTSDRVKGFKLWCLQDNEIVISKDVTFNEASMLKTSLVEKVSSFGGKGETCEQGGDANRVDSFVKSFGYGPKFRF